MGASHARALAERGACVVVNDLGGSPDGTGADTRPAELVAEQIRSEGGRAVASSDTVATAAGANAIVASAMSEFGRVDGILHNAGISTLIPLREISDGQWQRMLAVHLSGAFYLTRAAWPHLARSRGRVLYISSAVGFYGVPEMAHYGAAKSGMIGLSRVAAAEGREAGIGVNILGVAAASRIMDLAMADSPEQTDWFARYMKPELPSAAAVWLLHQDCQATGRIYQAFGPHMAEVFIAETKGVTSFDMTPEVFRDRFDDISDRSRYWEPDGADEFHAKTFDFIVEAGAERPASSGKLATTPTENDDAASVAAPTQDTVS